MAVWWSAKAGIVSPRLQARRRGVDAGARPAEHPRLPALPHRLHPMTEPLRRALLVDDSEIALRFLETRLQRWGLLIDRATGSDRALELLAAGPPYDFVFVDVELGPHSRLDGFALAQHIGRRNPDQPRPVLVMVSAHASPSHRARGQLAGCDAYLAKPLDAVELQRLLLRHGLKPRAATPTAPSVPG
jgi:CheY-like chemotaxis protein